MHSSYPCCRDAYQDRCVGLVLRCQEELAGELGNPTVTCRRHHDA
jgi:hypothetical protein